MEPTNPLPLISRLLFETPDGHQLSESRIRLLEAIDRHGSLSRAAKDVPLSYKAAWDALDDLNNLSPEPLVIRQVGGKNGGGSTLTERGRETIRLYRALEAAQQTLMERMAGARVAPRDADEQQDWLRGLTVRVSARNQFRGTVERLQAREGLVDVVLLLVSGDLLTASITPESVENMELAVGRAVLAWVKAPSVKVTSEFIDDPRGAWSILPTQIEAIVAGEGGAQAQLRLKTGGGLAVVSTLSSEVVAAREFVEGQSVCAMIRKDAVVLAVF